MIQQSMQVRIADPVACTAQDVDGQLASGTTDAKSVATMAGADERLNRSVRSPELQRDGEDGSYRPKRCRCRRGEPSSMGGGTAWEWPGVIGASISVTCSSAACRSR